MYRGKRRNEVPPHIFAISDGAYVNMLTSEYKILKLNKFTSKFQVHLSKAKLYVYFNKLNKISSVLQTTRISLCWLRKYFFINTYSVLGTLWY